MIKTFVTIKSLETWMRTHHAKAPELWIKIHKKDSGLRSVTAPEALTARGTSHRSSADPGVMHIGDEVAVARALRRLADHLLAAAEHDIEEVTGEVDVVVRAR